MFNWVRGRLATGYDKLLIFQSPTLMADCWLIRSREGVVLHEHTDPVPGYRHYRLNIVLRHAQVGGSFHAMWPIFTTRSIKLFRSDYPHSVSQIYMGKRLVLSFGLCLKRKDNGST